jgi:Protein of unknown function (DUF3703)
MPAFRLPAPLRPYYDAELAAATAASRQGARAAAWQHLERAHILGQRWPVAHTQVHYRMLRHGLRYGETREILGQLPRIVFGFLGSLVGRVPIGNTGGANVPPEQPMPIPADLQALLALVDPPR